LAPSVTALQKLLWTSEQDFDSIWMSISTLKSQVACVYVQNTTSCVQK